MLFDNEWNSDLRISGAVSGSNTPPGVSGVLNTSLARRYAPDKFNVGTVGFNAYDLIDYQLGKSADGRNDDVFAYLAECKSKYMRVIYPAYSFTNIRTKVFAGNIPNREYLDSDFTGDFLFLSDALFAQADENDIRLYLCIFWESDTICALFSETLAAFTNPESKTYAHMVRFTRWVCYRYRGLRAFSVVSFFNEPKITEFYPASPNSAADLGRTLSHLSSVAHSCDPHVITTCDALMHPTVAASSEQVSVDRMLDAYANLFSGLDAWCFHLYSERNFTGKNAALGFPADPTKSWGLEYAEPIVGAIANAARSDGKLVFIGETGVSSALEDDTSTRKRKRCIEIGASIADLTLIWNIQNPSRAVGPQLLWYIDPSPGGLRRDLLKSIVLPINSICRNRNIAEYGLGSFSQAVAPSCCFTTISGNASSHMTVPLPAIQYGNQRSFSVCFWVRINTLAVGFSTIMKIGPGLSIGISPVGLNYLQIDIPTGSWTCMPKIPIGRFFHFSVIYRVIDGQVHYDTLINGVFVGSKKQASPNVIAASQTAEITQGGTAAGSLSFQDVTIIPRPLDVSGILDSARGVIHPDALMHIKTDGEKLWDASRYNAYIGSYAEESVLLSGR